MKYIFCTILILLVGCGTSYTNEYTLSNNGTKVENIKSSPTLKITLTSSEGKSTCSGTLISKTKVKNDLDEDVMFLRILSAAHCFVEDDTGVTKNFDIDASGIVMNGELYSPVNLSTAIEINPAYIDVFEQTPPYDDASSNKLFRSRQLVAADTAFITVEVSMGDFEDISWIPEVAVISSSAVNVGDKVKYSGFGMRVNEDKMKNMSDYEQRKFNVENDPNYFSSEVLRSGNSTVMAVNSEIIETIAPFAVESKDKILTNKGDSGGSLFNDNDELIGVISAGQMRNRTYSNLNANLNSQLNKSFIKNVFSPCYCGLDSKLNKCVYFRDGDAQKVEVPLDDINDCNMDMCILAMSADQEKYQTTCGYKVLPLESKEN